MVSILISILILLFLMALLLSLPALLPPLRRWARSSRAARNSVVVTFGGVTFLTTVVICFIIVTHLSASVMVFKFWSGHPHQSDLMTEVWSRQVIPPSLSLPCYTTEPLCQLVNARGIGFDDTAIRFSLILGTLLGLITASINMFFVRRLTRSPRPNIASPMAVQSWWYK